MVFCCLQHKDEASHDKHFIIVSHYQQTPPLATSDKCHQVPRSVSTTLITPGSWSIDNMRWTEILVEKEQFLPVVVDPCPNIAITFGMEKLEWCAYPMVKKYEDVSTHFDRIHERDRQMDGQTYTARWPHLCTASCTNTVATCKHAILSRLRWSICHSYAC